MLRTMVYSKNGLHLTEGFESFRYVAYQDQGGVWTIAYGHTRGVRPGDCCTKPQGICWLLDDVKIAEIGVNHLVRPQLTQNEFDALVDFTFNLGVEKFAKSTMLVKINWSHFKDAALEFDKWDHIGAKEVAGLFRRREAERHLFIEG